MNLENLNVQEMNKEELLTIDGGTLGIETDGIVSAVATGVAVSVVGAVEAIKFGLGVLAGIDAALDEAQND